LVGLASVARHVPSLHAWHNGTGHGHVTDVSDPAHQMLQAHLLGMVPTGVCESWDVSVTRSLVIRRVLLGGGGSVFSDTATLSHTHLHRALFVVLHPVRSCSTSGPKPLLPMMRTVAAPARRL
jgi:hypothetical protein